MKIKCEWEDCIYNICGECDCHLGEIKLSDRIIYKTHYRISTLNCDMYKRSNDYKVSTYAD